MNKLDMESINIVDGNIEKIGELFPNVIVESENGKTIDFDLLKQELSNEIVEGNKEKYQLTWPGKKEAILISNQSTNLTLRPSKEDSVNFDTTQNIYIEGDNLTVLKILQESYLGKIKCIYIDPPYNTGNDFIYYDNFSKGQKEELIDSGIIDEYGNRLITNSNSNGKFHSDWLSMMYPRLKLARNLLKDNGIIFISIDDNELYNLKKMCDEIFGESNYIAPIIVKNNSAKNQSTFMGITTEYCLVYTKNIEKLKELDKEWRIRKKGASDINRYFLKRKNDGASYDEIKNEIRELYTRPKYSHLSRWNKVDEFGVFADDNLSRANGPKNYTIINPKTGKECKIPSRGWGKSYEELLRLQRENLIWYGDDNTPPRLKSYLKDDSLCVPDNYMFVDTSTDKKFLDEILGLNVFEYPKSVDFIENLIELAVNDDDIILDFFSGSGTTAHATLKFNAEFDKNIKYILVQIPEICNEKSEAFKKGYKTICKVGQERIRKAGQKIKSETNADIDYGFRVYKVDSSNMKNIYYKPSDLTQLNILDLANNIKGDRTSEDLLIQVILDLGLTLDLKIEEKNMLNNKVYFVENNSLVACFDDNVNIDIIDEICKYHPFKIVFKDVSFKSDKDKINLEERIKKVSPDTEISIL